MKTRAREDPHAPPERRYRGYVVDGELGLTDASAATEREALAKARRRWRLRWLGVECPGVVRLPDAEAPGSGQIALNGHRFALWRRIGDADKCVCWIMLNPSTADHQHDDATLRRIKRYSLDWGFGWLTVGNLWSYRATSTKKLKEWIATQAPYERRRGTLGRVAENDRYVRSMASRAALVMCAWGELGSIDKRAEQMLRNLEPYNVHALALTQAGLPRHPLRLAAALRPQPLAELRANSCAA